jgi:hypothetical protein
MERRCFQSRRNKVCLIHGQKGLVIRKEYRDLDALITEQRTLSLLRAQGIDSLPQVLWKEGRRLYLSYLPGENYADLAAAAEGDAKVPLSAAMEVLCDWIFHFSAVTGCLRGDVNLRNFLYDGRVCRSVDFEEPLVSGPVEEDLGRILSYLFTYLPALTPVKLEAGKAFLRRAALRGANLENLESAYLRELDAMYLRRGPAFLPILQKARNAFGGVRP